VSKNFNRFPRQLSEEVARRMGAKWLAILDTQWGDPGQARRWFPINPDNHSGRRLYSLTQSKYPQVWVTNSCREAFGAAHFHGVPDRDWLIGNLNTLSPSQKKLPLLICGQVAQKVFDEIDVSDEYWHLGPIVRMLHPAARVWSRELIEHTQRELKEIANGRSGNHDRRIELGR
jgi:hypothetical protein